MFLNPWLLVGVAGVSVPIVIHLLNQRKFQRVVWAAMRFVQISVEKNRRRMQIEDIILLILRCLIVALLAIALARPTIQHALALFGKSPVTAVFLIDNSYSMGKTDGVSTRFELAKKAADETIANLPRGSSAAVLLVSDVVRDVIPQPTVDLNLARQKVTQMAISDRGTNLQAGVQKALQTLEAASGDKEIYLITDGQAIGWEKGGRGGGEILRLMQESKDKVATHVLLVGDQDTQNLAVSQVRLSTELPTVNKALQFEVEVSNEGAAEAKGVNVRLFVDSETSPAEEAVIDLIPARSARSVALHARMRTDGFHSVTARVAADSLPADDGRSVVVRVLKQVQVLLVDGEAGREGREEDTFFVREALTPVPMEARGRYFIQTRTVTAGQLEQTSLDSFDALVLANVGELPAGTVNAIEKFVAQGRGLVVFTGPNVNASFYNNVLYRQRGILPAGLGEAVGDAGQGERFETLQSSKFEHPIMKLWNEEGRGNPGIAHFFRMYDLKVDAAATQGAQSDTGGQEAAPNDTGQKPGATKGGAPAVVASYTNGKPAIVEHTFGQGRVVLFGSSANTRWSDLAVRASIFIPLMHRTLDSLLERQDEHLAVGVGQKFVMRVGGELLGRDATVTRIGEGGTGAVEAATPASVRVDLLGEEPAVVFDATERGGIYKVAIDGAAEEPTLFAVQPDTAESDLLPLSKQRVDQIAQVAGVTHWKPGTVVEEGTAPADQGTEFWRPLATAVLVMALAETLLAYWFSKSK